MKIRWTKRIIFIGVAYLATCFTLAYVWDFVFTINRPFLSNIIAGLLTIGGGFLIAYWLIESYRINREVERNKRIKSALKAFKNFLLPWLFHHACELSGEFWLYDQNRIYTDKYKDDIPRLEDIFGIRVWDKNGKLIRGTDAGISDEILKRPLGTQFLYSSLEWGLRELEHVENRIREFPSLVEEVDPEVAKIVHLSNFIRQRIDELKEWDQKYGKEHDYVINDSHFNIAIRCNLRTVGRITLDVVIAIEANLEKFGTEL